MKIKTVTKIPFNDNDLFVVYEDDSGNEIADVTTCVPIDADNTDYQEVLEWIVDGGKISDAPVLETD